MTSQKRRRRPLPIAWGVARPQQHEAATGGPTLASSSATDDILVGGSAREKGPAGCTRAAHFLGEHTGLLQILALAVAGARLLWGRPPRPLRPSSIIFADIASLTL